MGINKTWGIDFKIVYEFSSSMGYGQQ